MMGTRTDSTAPVSVAYRCTGSHGTSSFAFTKRAEENNDAIPTTYGGFGTREPTRRNEQSQERLIRQTPTWVMAMAVTKRRETPRTRARAFSPPGLSSRPAWQGHLRLSLVSCAVGLYKATTAS
jgi:hypothetical protein